MTRSSIAFAFIAATAASAFIAGSASAQAAVIRYNPSPSRTAPSLATTIVYKMDFSGAFTLESRAQTAADDARNIVDNSRIDCTVAHARTVGFARDNRLVVEVHCESGRGYIIDAQALAPKAFSCSLLAAGAAEARAAGQAVPRESVCTMPENVG